jgi:micrococcal nuclease
MMTWVCRATVLRIIDGDTFAADFDLGWGTWLREVIGRPNRVRLLGIDTPERGEPGFTEAAMKLALAIPVGTTVWLESEKLDSFGRTLGVVRLDDGTDVRSLL